MCSIFRNKTADEHLVQLGRSNKKCKEKMEKKLVDFAKAASIHQAGPLDDTSCHLKDFPHDLKSVRRRRIGRHRVFYTGQHTKCSYELFYIKLNKKQGVEDEKDPRFQDTLRGALTRPRVGKLPGSDDDNSES